MAMLVDGGGNDAGDDKTGLECGMDIAIHDI